MSTAEDNGSLIQVIYASAATVPFNDEALDTLLDRARASNTELDVTGMLLFKDGTFFQVLEGEPELVNKLYEKIELDTRHGNVLLLAKRDIDERNFGQWSMGFVRSQKEVEQLPGFVDFFTKSADATFLDLQGDTQRIGQILDGFRRGRWRRQPAENIA